jgi:hypothetical protein
MGAAISQTVEQAIAQAEKVAPIVVEKDLPKQTNISAEGPEQANLNNLKSASETDLVLQATSQTTGFVQQADDLSFTKLTLLQNMVAENNQHLAIRISNLAFRDKIFENFDLKIGAKRIEADTFTLFGSVELREQQGKAPIEAWHMAVEDKWGKKLVLHLGPQLLPAERDRIAALSADDHAFIGALLQGLIAQIHNIDLNTITLINPQKQWRTLLYQMLENFNQITHVISE